MRRYVICVVGGILGVVLWTTVVGAGLKFTPKTSCDTTACEQIRGRSRAARMKRQQCYDRCDVHRCAKMSFLAQRNACFQEVAVLRQDALICHNISDIEGRILCYAKVGEVSQDPRICFRIPRQMSRVRVGDKIVDAKMECYRKIRALSPRANVRSRDFRSLLGVNERLPLLERICKGGLWPLLDLADVGRIKVRECGEYLRFPAPKGKAEIMVNAQGRRVAKCRQRIQGPEGPSDWGVDRDCEIPCDFKDHCQGVLLDCSALDLPDEMPYEYEAQIRYVRKKLLYDFLGVTAEQLRRQCELINLNRNL